LDIFFIIIVEECDQKIKMVLRNVYNHTWSDEYEILVRDIVDKAKKYVDITREQVEIILM
jgi:hypothetical protein